MAIVRPSSDILTGWATTPSGTSYTALDESTADTADYISASSAGLITRVGLGSTTDPGNENNHVLRYQADHDNADGRGAVVKLIQTGSFPAIVTSKQPWTQQPQVPVGIDLSNPLTFGLSDAYVASGKNNLAKSGVFATYYSGVKSSYYGLAAYADSLYPAIYAGNPGISVSASSSFTIAIVVPAAALAGDNPGVMRSGSGILTANAAGTGTTFCIVQGAGANRPWIRINGIDVLKPTSGSQLEVGKNYVIAFSVKSGISATVAWNGIIQHTATHSTQTPAFTYSYIGAQSNTAQYIGNIAAYYHINRALSDPELCSITNNPWQIFQPLTRRIYVGVPSATSDVTLGISGASVTASSGTVTASSAVSIALTGAQVSASGGTVTAALGVSLSLTGGSVTVTTGTLTSSSAVSKSLSGIAVTASQGTLGVSLDGSVSLSLSGQSVTATSGTLTSSTATSVALSGQQVTTYAGNVAIAGALTLTTADIDAIVAAIFAQAQITPIHADIRKVVDITVTGTGTESNPWGP